MNDVNQIVCEAMSIINILSLLRLTQQMSEAVCRVWLVFIKACE